MKRVLVVVLLLLAVVSFSTLLRRVQVAAGDLDPSFGSTTPSDLFGRLSTRAFVETGNGVLTSGFSVTGTGTKKVLVRALGPSLICVPGLLGDPTLELRDGNGSSIASNDNWRDSFQQAEIIATGQAPSNDLESAILVTISPGIYTAIVRGKNATTGVGMAEIIDVDTSTDSQLANISGRANAGTGDNVIVGGFTINGPQSQKVILRGLGPSLTAFGVSGALQDPTLQLRDSSGNPLVCNNNWRDTQQAEIQASGLAPTNDQESAILATLAPGSYTAVLRGTNNTTGVALVEVYNLGLAGNTTEIPPSSSGPCGPGPCGPTPTPTPASTPTPTPTSTPTPTPTPTPNTVQFSASNYNVTEACTTITITVNRSGNTSGAASVDYNTSDGTATERGDYITALGTLSFAPGGTSKSFVVLINDDSYVEGNETFNVNLSNPSGVTLGAPSIATVTILDNPTEPPTNAIDNPQNYVCQHYHDFLNRQADPDGLAFWTNQITSCGTDQACIQLKRITVSGAYFLSIEFQQTGYLVERMYKVAYGDATAASTFGGAHQLPVPIVRFKEFLRDTQAIGLGVVVLQPGWEQLLENNKQAFAADFAQRSRFTTALPTTMTPAQFVDKLNQNAGNVLSASDRTTAINLFGSATNTSNLTARAQALRQIAENQNLYNAEFNRAFVLMQYFGYLRRNPNDPQDTDYTGWEFWLAKLNQFNGNFVNAEMVKAFIVSVEYRSRFGP